MIRLTRLTDYAIVLLTRCALRGTSEPHTARSLAEETRLPLPMVSKVLKRLCREGLLDSRRGVHGGYSLAVEPATLSVAAIVRVFEGPVAITACSESQPGNCEHEPFCAVKSHWQTINDAVRVALESLTLADMARPLTQGLVRLSTAKPRPSATPPDPEAALRTPMERS